MVISTHQTSSDGDISTPHISRGQDVCWRLNAVARVFQDVTLKWGAPPVSRSDQRHGVLTCTQL